MKILKRIFIVISVAFIVLFSALYFSGIVINTTNSIPLGVYIERSGTPKKGDLVKVCLPESNIAEIALERHYISKGFCPDGYGHILKQIKAAEGDLVFIGSQGVLINGQLLQNSQPMISDLDGKKMPVLHLQKTLTADEFLLVTDHPKSFDGRYFGITKQNEIISRIDPLFIFREG